MALLPNPDGMRETKPEAASDTEEGLKPSSDLAGGVDTNLDEGETPATKEDEQQLEEATNVAMSIIHGEGEQGDRIASLVLDNQDIAKGVGDAVATVLIAVSKQMEYSDDVKIMLSMEIFVEITELAINAGALSADEIDESFIDASLSHAYTTYLTTKEAMGELDPEELQASVSEANKAGQEMGIVPESGVLPEPAQEKVGQAKGLMGRASEVYR